LSERHDTRGLGGQGHAAESGSAPITFRPLAPADLPTLLAWHHRPHVAARWDIPASVAELHDAFLAEADQPRATRGLIASQGGRDVGFVQVYCVMGSGDGWWPDETDPGARGVDAFLADEADLGRGLGRAMLTALVDHLFRDPAVTKVQADPKPDNERAVRCCLAAGFTLVGQVDTPDGRAVLLTRSREAAASPG
jgi:RimJ/RimL family protein N-acetyltransferase